MDIHYSKAAVKTIATMERKTKQRIKQAIEKIPDGDIKPLQGHDGCYRLRVGQWRIIFEYSNDVSLMIHRIAPRGDVYKGGF